VLTLATLQVAVAVATLKIAKQQALAVLAAAELVPSILIQVKLHLELELQTPEVVEVVALTVQMALLAVQVLLSLDTRFNYL
jgi:hypothetical protein